jgi:Response regulators consisting of a CheY-like receiver domain and a winged-helix DNA-binding domain
MQRILIVDDDPSVSSVLRRGLNYEAFAVDVAASGEEALEIARERYPDLVILDVMMPGLDGLEVLKRLRAADEHLPVLMLTAKDRDSDLVAGLEGGADDYLTKPFTFKVLLARVRALLRRSKSEHPAVLRFQDLSRHRRPRGAAEEQGHRADQPNSNCSRSSFPTLGRS